MGKKTFDVAFKFNFTTLLRSIAVINNRILTGREHCKQIEAELFSIEEEAKSIIGICNTQQFDLSLILFRRYSEFCDNTILSLAGNLLRKTPIGVPGQSP